MGIGSGRRERTHKDKAFILRGIGHLHQQRTHSEYRLCYQSFAAILGPILANFEWIASSRLLNCELSRLQAEETGNREQGTGNRPLFPCSKSLVINSLCLDWKTKPRR
jgi:hypothetical protein